MDIKLLGQGIEPASIDSVGNHLVALFKKDGFHTFTAISAFVSEAGINGIANSINAERDKYKKIVIITGVDQKGTSKEALEALLNLDIESYVFYQPSSSIFHPKIYLFEGDDKCELIIGSSNLTAHGLFVNVEASLLISIENGKEEDYGIIKQLKSYYDGLYNLSDPNLLPLDAALIAKLVSASIVPTEPERRKLYVKDTADTTKDLIETIFPKRIIAKVPAEFKSSASTATTSTPVVSTSVATSVVTTSTPAVSVAVTTSPVTASPASAIAVTPGAVSYGPLVWVRSRLPASSVQQSAAGTNPTGGLRLVQDGYLVAGRVIDQTTYFRNVVFGSFPWVQASVRPFVEVAIVPFEITIRGVNIGTFNLGVRHKPSGAAGQGNYTTSISWGDAAAHITAQNLTYLRLE